MTTRNPKPTLVRGTIKAPAGSTLKGAQARVRLLDTTYIADACEGCEGGAPTPVLVEAIIAILDDAEPIEFQLSGDVPAANGSYTVSVHVKVNSDPTRGDLYDAVEKGDFISTQSHPVSLSADATAEVEVEVHEV